MQTYRQRTGFQRSPAWALRPTDGLYQQPANFASALGGVYGPYASGLASTGKNYTDAFGAYGAGLGSLATARANERSNLYGANAMAEAARQGAVGNIGSAALGAYGGAANSALAAWAANQQAYNRAASEMHSANQQAMGNLGVSRNGALGALGGAFGEIGRAQVASNALSNMTSNMNFSMTGPGNLFGGGGGGGGGSGGFLATGPDGRPIAIGGGTPRVSTVNSGGGNNGMFSFTGSANRTANSSSTPNPNADPSRALSGLTGLQGAITDMGFADRVDDASQAGREQLDSQHYSSRSMPSQMLGQTLSGLVTLSDPAYRQSAAGMNQFYDRTRFDESPYRGMLGSLNQGFQAAGNQIGGVQRELGAGYGDTVGNIRNIWESSLQPAFDTYYDDVRLQQFYDRNRAGITPGNAPDEMVARYNPDSIGWQGRPLPTGLPPARPDGARFPVYRRV